MGLPIKDANGTSQVLPSPVDAVYHAGRYAVAAVTSATDCIQLTGSATKVVRILKARVTFVPGKATAASQEIRMAKRTSAASGGTQAALVASTDIAKHDSNDSAHTAVLTAITGTAATVGTLAGIVKSESLYASAATVINLAVEFNALSGGDKPIVLNSASEFFTIGFNGVTPGNTWNWELVWSEASS